MKTSSQTPISFVKYTAHGNTFAIVNELEGEQIAERNKAAFARAVTGVDRGTGVDGVLYVQAFSKHVIRQIDALQKYRAEREQRGLRADSQGSRRAIVRLFEPTGDEALICGNGMRCVGAFLKSECNWEAADLLMEVPSGQPRWNQMTIVGSSDGLLSVDVRMGTIPPFPSQLLAGWVAKDDREGAGGSIIRVKIPLAEVPATSVGRPFLVYSGEPYLVVLVADLDPVARDWIQPNSGVSTSFCDWAMSFNREGPLGFPQGLNVVACGIRRGGEADLDFRVFERLKNRETIASGSGAIAACAVVQHVGCREARFRVHPVRLEETGIDMGPIEVEQDEARRWSQKGRVARILAGSYSLPRRYWASGP